MSANFLTANLLYFVTRNNRSEDKGFPLYRWVILPTRTPTTSSLPDPERPFASWSMNVAPDCRTSAERDSCAIRRPVGPMAANCAFETFGRRLESVESGCGAVSGRPAPSFPLTGFIQDAYVLGVSTRAVDDLVNAMGETVISQSQVSGLSNEIHGKVKAFLDRPIEGDWPYLWIDATYVKACDKGRIVSAAVIVAVGVNSDGRREVLCMDIGPSEAETFWADFLRKLRRRGLRGVKLVVSDAHEGFKAAVAKVMHASWQRCRIHFLRNVLTHAVKAAEDCSVFTRVAARTLAVPSYTKASAISSPT